MNDTSRAALAAFIATHADASQADIVQMSQLSGGAIQENWLVRAELADGPMAGTLDLVVRTDSPSGVTQSHSRVEEFALLRAAYRAGVTVPEPLWLCENPELIGRPFFVMRRVAGTAAGRVLVKDLGYGGDRGALAERLGEELALIHAIRPPHESLAFLPVPTAAPSALLIARVRQFLDEMQLARPALEWGLRWLELHAPAAEDVVLCHRDYRTGNYMVDEHGLTGILDWEFAGWGNPLEDIGWFCAKCWRFGAADKEAGGIGQREDFYRGYERVAGAPLARDAVPYWEVMAHMNWALIALQQAQRHMSGNERSLFLALTGHIVPELEYEILTMTKEMQ
ncbi:phosphotransferase family protein [Duganella sp. Dugasp56]|uniref:phosphotransferase family protein n=1 Tax=Duganella sp. Dugasp56 TaxID=3243046 RepID=UPI0039B06ACE